MCSSNTFVMAAEPSRASATLPGKQLVGWTEWDAAHNAPEWLLKPRSRRSGANSFVADPFADGQVNACWWEGVVGAATILFS
jgi:hypothetical protein